MPLGMLQQKYLSDMFPVNSLKCHKQVQIKQKTFSITEYYTKFLALVDSNYQLMFMGIEMLNYIEK